MLKYLAVALLAAGAFLGGTMVDNSPYCPEEDSCDYYGNTWHETKEGK